MRPGYGVLGAEEAITIAHHQPGGMGPGQGLCGIIGDQPCVLEAAEGSAGRRRFAQVCRYVPIGKGCSLLPGYGGVGGKDTGVNALGNAVGFCPGHSVGIVSAGLHILEGSGTLYLGLPGQTVQGGDHHAPGHALIGGKQSAAQTPHQAVGDDIVGVGMIPDAGVQVREGAAGAAVPAGAASVVAFAVHSPQLGAIVGIGGPQEDALLRGANGPQAVIGPIAKAIP